MKAILSFAAACVSVCCLTHVPTTAQEKSVRPGINKPFEDPDLPDFLKKFEGESREIATRTKEIIAACKIKPGMMVADVGAGTGLLTRKFATEVGEKGKVYAVDIPDAIMLGWLEYFQKAAAESIEPVTFEFKRNSGPVQGRNEAFDANAQVYNLHVHDIARFEVKGVVQALEKRTVVLKITGMLDKPEGPLTFYVTETDGKKKEFVLHHQGYDKEFFRIERKDGVTIIEFLPKGKALLRPGVWFQYVDFFRN